MLGWFQWMDSKVVFSSLNELLQILFLMKLAVLIVLAHMRFRLLWVIFRSISLAICNNVWLSLSAALFDSGEYAVVVSCVTPPSVNYVVNLTDIYSSPTSVMSALIVLLFKIVSWPIFKWNKCSISSIIDFAATGASGLRKRNITIEKSLWSSSHVIKYRDSDSEWYLVGPARSLQTLSRDLFVRVFESFIVARNLLSLSVAFL